MNQRGTTYTAAALGVLGDLSGASGKHAPPKPSVVGRKADFIWEGRRHLSCFVNDANPSPSWWGDPPNPQNVADRDLGNHLAALDALQPNHNVLSVGWLWFAGKANDRAGKPRSFCFPAISVTVVLDRWARKRVVRPVDDPVMAPLIDDASLLHDLEQNAVYGLGLSAAENQELWLHSGLQRWGDSVAQACGLAVSEWSGPDVNPFTRKSKPGIAAIAGCGIFVGQPAPTWNRGTQLHDWSTLDGIEDTAFEAVYDSGNRRGRSVYPTPHEAIRVLNETQQAVVQSSMRQRVTTVSGPPGTGKTHTIVEIAMAAIARGESVLVGANSPHAVEVLREQFADSPGPRPITFGGQRVDNPREQILARLNSGADKDLESDRRHARDEAAADRQRLIASIGRMLTAEFQVARLTNDPASRLDMEDRLERAGDIGELRKLVARYETDHGIVAKLRRKRLTRTLTQRFSLRADAGAREFRTSLDAVDNYLLARRVLAAGGLTLIESFDQLAQRDKELRDAGARWLDAAYLTRVAQSRSGRQALGEIATAAGAGRVRRRAILEALDAEALGEAAPLWLGAVRDIDDVLPASPGFFDLVVLDEASQIDQPSAAGALLRAKRAVICGDPHQLRHVSFLSDDEVDRSNDARLGPEGRHIDVRRNSIFDVASRAGNGFQLDEHYRCDPHLIDFSARRFYQRNLHVATTTPLNHDADHIDVHMIEGARNDNNINVTQIQEALRIVQDLIADGIRGIGIVTPFRAQADAMTELILRNFRAEEIEDYGLAVGTVHAFQGAEHTVVIAMCAIGESEGNASWRFVNDANLFNVMVTRARKQMIVLTSQASPPGLAGEYLVHADPLSRTQVTEQHTRLWPSRVASALEDTSLEFWPNYMVGKHRLDFALIVDGTPTALTVEPHLEGADAHIERELALRRLGWDATDSFESRWGERLGELIVTLTP